MGCRTLGSRAPAYALALLLSTMLFASSASAAGRDKRPPTTPSNLTVAGTTTTGFTVSWTAATDRVGVAGYGVWLDGSAVGTTTATSRAFTGLACGTTHTVTVDAFDAAG